MAGRAKQKAEKVIVSLKMTSSTRSLIERAAKVAGKTCSAFMVECAHYQAAQICLDRQSFKLDGDQCDKFFSALDARPKPNAKLKRLLASASQFEW